MTEWNETDVPECRVFVIDDDPSVCKGLSRLLHSAGYETEVFHSAIDYLQRESFDGVGCLILDIRMPQLSGTDLQLRLKQQKKDLPIIFLTAHGELPMGIEAMKQGAVDFLIKPVDETSLLDTVRRALARHRSVRKERLQTADARARQDTLTPREFEILQYILGGAKNKQIAEELCITEKTVKAHRGKIMRKLNVSSPAEMGWISSFTAIAVKK
jgi:FixJ family two-component response regulator